MNRDLKPYQAYKDSGVPWLGEVPEHWEIRRMKTLIRERNEKGFPNEPLLAATQTQGVVRKEQYENRTVLALKDLHLLKLVRVRDFVISLRSFQGGIEYAREQGIISPAYTILFPIQAEMHGFLAWLFKSRAYIENLSLYVTGIRQGQNIDYQRLSRSGLPVPPLQDRTAISRFLEYSDRRIRKYVSAKRKLIALLNEQKQAIIHQAVTRGLDPNVCLKPSGAEWLGEVPEHWEIRKLSFVCSLIVDGTHFSPKSETTGDFLYITAKNIKERGVDTGSASYISAADHAVIYRRCPVVKGDVLYIKDGATAGLATVNDLGGEFSMLSSVALIRPRRDVVRPEYLSLLLNDRVFKDRILRNVVGGAMTRFTVAIIKRIGILTPPVGEQDSILRMVDTHIAPLRTALARMEHDIVLMREYRARLIADVVTGKVDVRDAGAPLANEPEGLQTQEGPEAFEEELDETGDPNGSSVEEESES